MSERELIHSNLGAAKAYDPEAPPKKSAAIKEYANTLAEKQLKAQREGQKIPLPGNKNNIPSIFRPILKELSEPTDLPVAGSLPDGSATTKNSSNTQTTSKTKTSSLTATSSREKTTATPSSATSKSAPAYRNAYFNKDNLSRINQGTSDMRALRGEESALDLKKVVLPASPYMPETVNHLNLQNTSELMGLDGTSNLDLATLLSRQGAWSTAERVTVEMILERLAHLEQMIADRQIVLQRMQQKLLAKTNMRANQELETATSAAASPTPEQSTSPDSASLSRPWLTPSTTLNQALKIQSGDREQSDNLLADGTTLITETTSEAYGLHQRLAKLLGLKAKF